MTDRAEFDLSGKRVFVAGNRGMVGAALVRRLAAEKCTILTAPKAELDLTRQGPVEEWLAREKPDAVFLAAARVGGIHANNSRPAEFLYENLAIQSAVMHGAWKAGVRKLLFLGSTCIYPRLAPQPMREDALLTGPLEPTNEWYAIAKIAGLKMCHAYKKQYGVDFIACMPTNLYGPHDNYDLEMGHVPAAIIAKVHRAKLAGDPTIPVWGDGSPMREFMHVDDLADACVFLMKNYTGLDAFNVGTGKEVTIAEFARTVCKVAGYSGSLAFDTSKPNGAPRKLTDPSRLMALGWRPKIDLEPGLADAYRWYVDNVASKAA
ncbi:MAG: GDP-L-fucose synthase [Rhodospirillales bacterium]|nr:GDP-L-fucose synthase [Rhodospirillales bacterium]